jgi:hypothetical protein
MDTTMTTEVIEKAIPTSISTTAEDRERMAAIAKMLRQRGMRSSASAVVSYAVHRVFLLECSTDGAQAHERNAA